MTALGKGSARVTNAAGRNWFFAAAALTAMGAGIHVMAGTPEVMQPLYTSGLPPASAAVLDVVWQQVTALLVGGTIAMVVAALRAEWRRPVAWLIGGHFLVVAIIFVVWGLIWFNSLWPMPQWTLFGLIGGMMFWAARP